MPSFDLVLLVRKLEQTALKEVLRRSANYIFEVDGTIRKMENLGFREMPYSISAKGKSHKSAHYFLFNYDASNQNVNVLKEKFNLDVDVIRMKNFKNANDPMELHLEQEKPECTAYLDLLPPPQRPEVMKIQEVGQRKRTRKERGWNFKDVDFLIY